MNTVPPIPESLRTWSRFCRDYQSEYYADLLTLCANDFDHKGPVYSLLESWQGDPISASLPLRLMAGVHHCVLSEPGTRLHSCYYPTHEELRSAEGTWPFFLELVLTKEDELRDRLTYPPQTNDIQRSAALLIGHLAIAYLFDRPVQLRELGASAGLNLLWDKFHYRLGDHEWGPSNSRVRIGAHYDGPGLNSVLVPQIEDRMGCDNLPRDVSNPDDYLQLASNIWPTQETRLANFENAVQIAREAPPPIDQASAAAWLTSQLADRRSGCAMVVYHSAVWNYISADEQNIITSCLEEAGRTATTAMPLARLSLEFPIGKRFEELRLTTWPGGEERLIATINTRSNSIRCCK